MAIETTDLFVLQKDGGELRKASFKDIQDGVIDGIPSGDYLRIDSGAGDQTVQSTGTTTFNGDVEAGGDVINTGGNFTATPTETPNNNRSWLYQVGGSVLNTITDARFFYSHPNFTGTGTLPSIIHFQAQPNSRPPVTLTVNQQVGFNAGANLTGDTVTNAYGFKSDLNASSNNNYSFYAAGDAPSFFQGITEHKSGVKVTGDSAGATLGNGAVGLALRTGPASIAYWGGNVGAALRIDGEIDYTGNIINGGLFGAGEVTLTGTDPAIDVYNVFFASSGSSTFPNKVNKVCGLRVDNNIANAVDFAQTNSEAFGVYSSIEVNASDKRYNFYAAGSAPSFFQGITEHKSGVKVTGGDEANVVNGIGSAQFGDQRLYTIAGGVRVAQFAFDGTTVLGFNGIAAGKDPLTIRSDNAPSVAGGSNLINFQGRNSGDSISTFGKFGTVLQENAGAGGGIAKFAFELNSGGGVVEKAYVGARENFFVNDTYIGGTSSRSTRELWESTLTEEQKEQLSAGTLAIPANVSTPGDGEFVRQWWYDQQSAEDQALIDSGELEYPSHFQAANFVDTFDLGVGTRIHLLSNGDAVFKDKLFNGNRNGRDTIWTFSQNVTPRCQIEGGLSDGAHLLITRPSDTEFGGYVTLAKSRGNGIGSSAVVQEDDSLGQFRWSGDDGTNFEVGASIEAFVDGTPGNDNMPGRIEFATTPSGSKNPVRRLTIDSTGLATFGGLVEFSHGVKVTGGDAASVVNGIGSRTYNDQRLYIFAGGQSPAQFAFDGTTVLGFDGVAANKDPLTIRSDNAPSVAGNTNLINFQGRNTGNVSSTFGKFGTVLQENAGAGGGVAKFAFELNSGGGVEEKAYVGARENFFVNDTYIGGDTDDLGKSTNITLNSNGQGLFSQRVTVGEYENGTSGCRSFNTGYTQVRDDAGAGGYECYKGGITTAFPYC